MDKRIWLTCEWLSGDKTHPRFHADHGATSYWTDLVAASDDQLPAVTNSSVFYVECSQATFDAVSADGNYTILASEDIVESPGSTLDQATMDTIRDTVHLSRTYRKSGTAPVLGDVTFYGTEQELVAVMGETGTHTYLFKTIPGDFVVPTGSNQLSFEEATGGTGIVVALDDLSLLGVNVTGQAAIEMIQRLGAIINV